MGDFRGFCLGKCVEIIGEERDIGVENVGLVLGVLCGFVSARGVF